jgi:tetratricopeptide (TPR) repeat protein
MRERPPREAQGGDLEREREGPVTWGVVAWLLVGGLVLVAVGPITLPPLRETPNWERHVRAAEVAYQEGRYDTAEELMLLILEEAEEFGPDDARLGFSLINLAVLYRKQGRYREAEPLYPRGLVILEKTYGEEHPVVAGVLEDWAALLRETGRERQAAEMDARASVIRAKRAQRGLTERR